jgi:hypothetical protein
MALMSGLVRDPAAALRARMMGADTPLEVQRRDLAQVTLTPAPIHQPGTRYDDAGPGEGGV